MERVIDRFDKYLETKGLSSNQVTVDLGLSIGLLGKSRKKGKDLSKKTIEKIIKFYTDLNSYWLLTGQGDMLIAEDDVELSKKTKVYPGSNMERILRRVNEQAEEPLFDYEVINPKKAVRELLALVVEKDLQLQQLKRELDDYKDRYLKLLEELSGKKDQGKCG